MYARISTEILDPDPPVDSTDPPSTLVEQDVLEGTCTEDVLMEFIRQVFRSELVRSVGYGDNRLKNTKRIVIDFRTPDERLEAPRP